MLPFYIPWKHQKKTLEVFWCFQVVQNGNIDLKWVKGIFPNFLWILNLFAPTPKNGQTYSNNSSSTANELLECVWPLGLTISPISVLWKKCAEKMQQIYRTTFSKDTYGELLLTSYASDPNSKLLNVNLLPDPF